MSTVRIKDKLSELINSQLPEFIRSDYTTFVAFLQYYYKFLEQDQGALELVQNARQYSDIDQTSEAFVNYFITNYAKDLPLALQVNKPLLIKKIEGLYKAKGSQLSIETLFRVLYDTYATTRHPYDFVLRPSDGQWSLRSSIRVLKTSGSTADIKDRFLTVIKNNIKYTVEITRIKNLTADLFEVFYYSNISVPFEINDSVYVSGTSDVIFTGTVKPTTTSWSISQGGSGFRAGQVFNLSVSGAVDTLVRITKVGATGNIQALRILNYGYNFTNDISILLTNALGVSALAKNFNTTAGGFSETFEILRPHTGLAAVRYFDTDYVSIDYTGTLEVSAVNSSQKISSVTASGENSDNIAIITFGVGAIARYPGEYTSTQGFLSEPDVRLQDRNLYQPFAYQIESELDISVFYDIVKKLVHQAGTNMFVNRVISTSANISANITVETRKNVSLQFNSVFTTLDSSFYNLQLSTVIDSTNINDAAIVAFAKTISDDITIPDSALVANNLAALLDSLTPSETLSLAVSKSIIDDSNVNVTESLTQVFSKYVDNTDSTITISDSGVGLLLDYTDSSGISAYFAETYAGGSVLTF
tara:strand:+ start:726 stop:2489 length:1764 start_codon:yes stop_codon:yes gene_type:complete